MEPAVTIVGAGNVGASLARALSAAGHEVTVAVRDPDSAKANELAGSGITVVPLAGSAEAADVVIPAVPFPAAPDALASAEPRDRAVVVDPTNAVGRPVPDGHRSVTGWIASQFPELSFVKAFNTIGAEWFSSPQIEGRRLFMPIAGEPEGASTVRALASSLGFDAVVVGDGSAIPIVEDFAALWIHLARSGHGRDFGFAMLQEGRG